MLTQTIILLVPTIMFFVLLLLGREEVGIKWALILIAVLAALLAGTFLFGLSIFIFVSVLALIDIILLLCVFGGDINLS